MSGTIILIFLLSFLACTYYFAKYMRLVIINAKAKGFRECKSTIATLLREEPLFLILYFGFLIFLNVAGNLLVYLLN